MTIKDFLILFPSEAEAKEYCRNCRWPQLEYVKKDNKNGNDKIDWDVRGVECPKCKHGVAYIIDNWSRFKCKKCGTKFTAVNGTIFHWKRYSYKEILLMIYLFLNDSKISSYKVRELANLQQRQVNYFISILRQNVPNYFLHEHLDDALFKKAVTFLFTKEIE